MAERHDELDLPIGLSAAIIGSAAVRQPGQVASVYGSGYEMKRTGPASNQPQSSPQHPCSAPPGGAMSVRYREASFVVPQVVGRAVPLVVPQAGM